MAGSIILLNGTSSAGKTTLGQALQDQADGLWLLAGLDQYLAMLGKPYLSAHWGEILGDPVRPGMVGDDLIRAMYAAAAAAADSGVNVVVDHVLVSDNWRRWACEVFAPRRAWLVGVRCDPVALEAREQARGDRTPGQAVRQYNVVHEDCVYDIEIDTTHVDADAGAAAVLAHIAANEPRGFAGMRGRGQETS